MRLPPVLAALSLLSAPAAAQTVTHNVEGRFGVVYERAPDGSGGMHGVYDTEYTMTLRRSFDNGWSMAVSIGVGLGNVERRGPRYHPGAQPGLQLTAPGS